MSDILRAWYVFITLALITFILNMMVGQIPYPISNMIAKPNQLLFRASANLKRMSRNIAQRQSYEQEIADLKQQVATLKSEKRKLEIDLEHYEQALNVRIFQAPGVVDTAAVIGIDPSPIVANITLNKGRSSQIKKFMPVIAPAGLVGIVTDVVERTAKVRLITDPNSRIGVTVSNKGGQGIAIGEIGGLVRVVNYFVDHTLAVGDSVETSSRGGLFPRGIIVGEIVRVEPKDPNSLYQEFIVEPAVEMHNLLEVALVEPL